MTLALTIKPRAQQDVDEHTAYLDDRDAESAERFHTELKHVFDRLTAFPALGQRWQTDVAAHQDIRRAILRTLPFSVFYRPTGTTIEVVRVLHQAQDIPPLLDEL